MSLNGVIGVFATGTYTVTRTVTGTYTAGRYTDGATGTFDITASVQPVSGRDLQFVAEGEHGNEVKVVYTSTPLFTRTPTTSPDKVAIDGETYEVFRVEKWQHFGISTNEDHFRVFVSRLTLP